MKALKKITSKFQNSVLNRFGKVYYSQEGEDAILNRYFDGRRKGFFIDIGALHPVRFSNTYFFYKLGWNGINIEPRPGSKKIFDSVRNKDINLEVAIASESKKLTYYSFNEPALNGFSDTISSEREKISAYKIIDRLEITTHKLEAILDEHLSENQKIDFLTIDVEGLDYDVLLSNNWEKYKPEVVLIEDLNFSFVSQNSPSSKYLTERGYELFAKTINTVFYKQITVKS